MPRLSDKPAPFGALDPWSLLAIGPLLTGAVLAVSMSAPRVAVALGCLAVTLIVVDSWSNRPPRSGRPASGDRARRR